MPNPEHPFKIAGRFGYRALLHAQLRRRLGARLHHSKKYIEIAQSQAGSNGAHIAWRSMVGGRETEPQNHG